MKRYSGIWVAEAVATAALVIVASVIVVDWGYQRLRHQSGTTLPTGNYTLVNYTSSVDGYPLSYYEWLPDGYQPSQTYPLAIYLHGQYMDGDELIIHSGGPEIVAAAQEAGFILISINTPRSSTGFYVNSIYTGPEEQDVLDAITHEEQLRHIGDLYLFGSSMGTVGTYSIAGHHPGMFAGIGVLNSCPDAFEAIEWRIVTNNQASLEGVVSVLGAYPNQTPYALGLTYYLSSARYFPQNYSGVRIYVTQGGNDQDCPNNPHIWPYENANNTVLTSTCTTVPQLDQPPDCTVPFANFSRADPSAWNWRYVYEPTGIHDLNEVNATDLFAFWSGTVGSGLYWGGYPFGTDLIAHSY